MISSVIRTVVFFAVFATAANVATAGLKIYYIRHAEGGHNVKKAWQARGVPEAELPACVGNPNMFTPRWLKEVVGATEKLQKYKSYSIASSPMWRHQNTRSMLLET